ncbi:Homeobox protein HD-11 [Nosema granulosis]|uniref:Homeobox protein HD-11 n=1 Tax=Nosema granulosis TaxID=83296 RepID=A0A9P6KXS4_9MICR|nr:Homeobox protein HD-11 [Nosema granulosis]
MFLDYIGEEKKLQAVLGLLKLKGGCKNEGKKSLYQNLVLRKVFNIIKYPSQQTRKDLSFFLNLSEKSIKLWFQNERQSEDKYSLRNGFVGFEINPLILYRICRDVAKQIVPKKYK